MSRDDEPLSGLGALYVQHRSELLRFLSARAGDAEEAADLVQELWLKVVAAETGPIANGRAYLFRMAHNLVLDRVRERRRRVARDQNWQTEMTGTATGGAELADRRSDPEQDAIERDEVARVAAAIAALPEGARRAFRMHKIDGLTHGEVAARLGISRSGVEKHIAVAMKHLRQALRD